VASKVQSALRRAKKVKAVPGTKFRLTKKGKVYGKH
jgi:hypothetical protein